jgi:hypothetical protein
MMKTQVIDNMMKNIRPSVRDPTYYVLSRGWEGEGWIIARCTRCWARHSPNNASSSCLACHGKGFFKRPL